MDELGLEIDGEYDLNEIESRLYSQVFHSSEHDEIVENVLNHSDNDKSLNVSGKSCFHRYYERGPQTPLTPISIHITVDRTEALGFDNSQEATGFWNINHSNLRTLTPLHIQNQSDIQNFTRSQYVVPVVCSSNPISNPLIFENLHQHNANQNQTSKIQIQKIPYFSQTETGLWYNKMNKKNEIRKLRRKKAKLSKQLNKKIIFISDDSEDDCMLKEQESKMGSLKNTNSCSNQMLVDAHEDDDVIYIPPPPVQIINVDDDDSQSPTERSEPQRVEENQVKQDGDFLNQKNENTNISECTSNDFLDNTVDKNIPSTFNFALHGSDFNSGLESVETNTTVDFCETESSCSTNEHNKDFNNSAKTVFDEVEFPKNDIFSDKNLDNFGSFITPKRINKNVENSLNNSIHSNNTSSLLVDTDSSTSSTESDYEPMKNTELKKVCNSSLPVLSPMLTQQELPELRNTLKVNDNEENHVSPFKTPVNNKTDTANLQEESPKIKLKKKKNRKKFENIQENCENLDAPKETANTEEQEKSVKDLVRKKKRKKDTMTISNFNDEHHKDMELMADVNPQTSTNTESTGDEPITRKRKKRKRPKKAHVNDNENEIEVDNLGNDLTVLETVDERRENGELDSTKSEKELIEEVYNDVLLNEIQLNEIQDPSDINLFNNTFFEEIEKQNDIQEVEDNDIIVMEKTERSNSDDVIVIDDLSDSEVEVIETISETNEVNPVNSSNLELGNCTTAFSSSEDNSVLQLNDGSMEYFNNFDVKLIQSQQSDDPSKWMISHKDSNSYVELGKKGPRCYRCRHFGHVGSKCPDKPNPPCCSLCGDEMHQEPRCPNKVCRQCGNIGDYSTSYCYLCFKYRHITCNLCRAPGHLSKYCPDLWRRYHLTTEEGPIILPKQQVMRPRNEQWCSGCAQQGHLEHECNDIYYHREFPPTRPDIIIYSDVLNDNANPRNIPYISVVSEPAVPNYLPLNRIPSLLSIKANPPNTIDSNIIIEVPNLVRNPCVQPNVLETGLIEQIGSNIQNSNMNPTDANIIQEMSHNFQNNILPIKSTNSNEFQDLSKFDMKKIRELFMSMSQATVKSFIKKQVEELDTKIKTYNPRVLRTKLFKNDKIPENASEKLKKERLFWFRVLNMFIFGLHNLNDGKLHMRFIRKFLANGKSTDFDEFKRRSLFNSYAYIFGVDKHKNVSYHRLIKLLIDKTTLGGKNVKPFDL